MISCAFVDHLNGPWCESAAPAGLSSLDHLLQFLQFNEKSEEKFFLEKIVKESAAVESSNTVFTPLP